MSPFDSSGGRFMVGRDRLSFQTGMALGHARATVHDIPGIPASFVLFDDFLTISELDQIIAQVLAERAGFDPKRWYEGIEQKQVYLLTLATSQRFIYVWCIVDCWRSFLFPFPEPTGNQ